MGIEDFLKQEEQRFIRENLMSDEVFDFIRENTMPFNELMAYYRCAIMEVETKFKVLNEQFSLQYDRNPIETIKTRIKSTEGIIKKANKKNIPFTMESIEQNIRDIAGIRVICSFTEDIYMLADCLLQQDDITLIEKKDYIKNPKESGYRSYHLIVHYEVETVKGTTIIPVEIQIRTLGMNFWAIIEHSLQYKYNGEIPAHVKERLNAASDALITLDNEMSSIHDEIINSQTYFMVKANIVSDILSTIQNLYKVANKQVVIKIQDEFYEIFEKGDVNELSRFSRQLDIIAEDYRAQSVQ